MRAVPRQRQTSVGRAGTWSFRKPVRRATARAGTVSSAARVCSGSGRAVRTEALAVRVPPGRPTAPASACRRRDTPAGNGGRTGDLYVTVQVLPHPLFRREGDDLHVDDPGGRSRGGARRDASKCRRSTVPVRLRFRRAPRAVSSSGSAVAACRRWTEAGATWSSTCSWCCRRRVDERSQELLREFGRAQRRQSQKSIERRSQTRHEAKRSGGKAYYMISAVAQKYNIHPQTLRLYEREGLLKPSRTEGNTRLYSEEDLEQLETILSLTRDLGVNLAGVEIILNMRRKIEAMQHEVNEFMDYVKRELSRGLGDWEQRLSTALVKSSPTDLVRAPRHRVAHGRSERRDVTPNRRSTTHQGREVALSARFSNRLDARECLTRTAKRTRCKPTFAPSRRFRG